MSCRAQERRCTQLNVRTAALCLSAPARSRALSASTLALRGGGTERDAADVRVCVAHSRIDVSPTPTIPQPPSIAPPLLRVPHAPRHTPRRGPHRGSPRRALLPQLHTRFRFVRFLFC